MSARFHRSTREAFPAERYAAIQIFPRRPRISGDKAVACALALGIAAVSLMASWGWL